MLEERLVEISKRERDNVTTDIKAYLSDGDEACVFRLYTEKYGKNSPSATLDLPKEGYYDDDIPILVEVILKLVSDQKDRLPRMNEQIKDICFEFIKEREQLRINEPDLSSSIVIGPDGRLREELIKEDE